MSKNHSDCFIDQDNTALPAGNESLHVVMADTAGLDIAYEAYKTRLGNNEETTGLPGLEAFSGKQLFFLRYGYTMCQKDKQVSVQYSWINYKDYWGWYFDLGLELYTKYFFQKVNLSLKT